jgi:hypothetical protein
MHYSGKHRIKKNMINGSTYQAARAVAATIEQHFADHLAAARQRGDTDLAHEPKADAIEAIIDAAFWASLRREEGHSPRISLALLPQEQAGAPMLFEQRLPLTSTMLTKLAPGLERPGIHLGVWQENDAFYVWGATHKIPNLCLVLDITEPGLLVIKHRRMDGFGKFSNVAVLTGDEVKIVDERSGNLPDCPSLVTSLLKFTSPSAWNNSVNVLLQLAVSMRSHKRGGTLLVVPASSTEWRESIRQPIHYAIAPAFSGLASLMQQEESLRNQSTWNGALSREVELVAGLTAIDGAIIINDQYQLLAFGAKITRPDWSPLVEQIVVTEPIYGGGATIVHPGQEGGTRHLSAAQFVHDQRDTVAMVASQDGRFTVYTWSVCENMVQAHRIDSLLL